MYVCDAGDCKRPDERVGENDAHVFSGYGYLVHFHPECCPRAFDGSDCHREHSPLPTDDDALSLANHLVDTYEGAAFAIDHPAGDLRPRD